MVVIAEKTVRWLKLGDESNMAWAAEARQAMMIQQPGHGRMRIHHATNEACHLLRHREGAK
jgi:hypothetical protein